MATQRWMAADELDWNLFGPWNQSDGLGQPTFCTSGEGGDITYDFNGTAIKVYGTKSQNDNSTLECFIDGLTTGTPPLIENTDPSVHFNAQWGSLGDSANVTTKQGSLAQVDFTGTSISWIGFTPPGFPNASAHGTWRVDNEKENNFSLNALSQAMMINNVEQCYFTTPDLGSRPHTLTVTFEGSEDTTPLVLHHLLVKNSTIGNSSVTTSGSMTSSSTRPMGDGQSRTSSGNSQSPTGAIVGGVLGGLAFLLCIAGVLLFCLCRRTQQWKLLDREASSLTQLTHFPLNTVKATDTGPNSANTPDKKQVDVSLPTQTVLPALDRKLGKRQASPPQPTLRHPKLMRGAGIYARNPFNSDRKTSQSRIGIAPNRQPTDKAPPKYRR